MIKLLSLLVAFLAFSIQSQAQNYGFEGSTTTPPTNWASVTGTWRTLTDTARTGKHCMAIINPATTGTTAGSTSTFFSASGGKYLVTIMWAMTTVQDGGRINPGYRRGTTHTLNPSSTTASLATGLDAYQWKRVTSVSAAVQAAGPVGPALRAFKLNATMQPTIYIDDMIIYESVNPVVDTIKPDVATSAFLQSATNMTWVNGLDNHADASGRAGVVILRAAGNQTVLPQLNDQAMYDPINGVAGTDSVHHNGISWVVVAHLNDSSLATFTDATAGAGAGVTYAIYTHDFAYNYSPGVAFISACTGQPSLGMLQNNATAFCEGDTLHMSVPAPAIGLQLQWQEATLTGAFVDIVGATRDSISIRQSNSMRYRAYVRCSASGLADTSGVITTSVTLRVIAGTLSLSNAGPNYTFLAPNVANETRIDWDFADGTTDTGRIVVKTFLTNGQYRVRMLATNSCSIDSAIILINVTTVSVEENDLSKQINLYPNPVTTQLQIASTLKLSHFSLHNLKGEKIQSQNLEDTAIQQVNLAILPEGVYLATFETADGKYIVKRIVVQK